MNATAPLPQLSHDQLQAECYQWFHNAYPEQRGLLHANANNSVNKVKGNQQKALGVVKGVLDMEYFRANRLYFFDIKVGKDRFSQAQHEFMAQVIAEGAKCYEIRSLEQFQTIIREINNMPQLTSVRSNMHLEVDYKNGELTPMVEVIFLLAVPVYSLSSEGETVKNVSLQDVRFKATKGNIETLTKQLQEFSKMMEPYSDLTDDFNSAIVKPQSPNEPNEPNEPS